MGRIMRKRRDKLRLTLEGGICKICELRRPIGDFVQDHCHATGFLRDKICRKCNALLGFADDEVFILGKAIDYLKHWHRELKVA